MTDAISTVGLGSALGAIVCYVVVDRPVAPLVLAAAALGSVLTTAVRSAVGGTKS